MGQGLVCGEGRDLEEVGSMGGAGPRGRMGRDKRTGSDWDSREGEAVSGGRMGRGPRRRGGRRLLSDVPSPLTLPSPSGSEVRVLLFNSTGDRDSAALLKLLQVRNWLGYGQQAGQLGCWL